MPKITRWTLVDVNTGIPIPQYNPLVNGCTFDIADPQLANWVIQPTLDASTQSVIWKFDGAITQITTNDNPIYLRQPSRWVAGPHSISASPCSDVNGSGSIGISLSVSFNLRNLSTPPLALKE